MKAQTPDAMKAQTPDAMKNQTPDAMKNQTPDAMKTKTQDAVKGTKQNVESGTALFEKAEVPDVSRSGGCEGIGADVKPLGKVTHIIVHCSATPEGRDVSAADIDRYHRRRGFACIGYHRVVRLDGRIEHGRSESLVGAHCRGLNRCSIGVCYVGGTDAAGRPKDTRTPAQRKALLQLLSDLRHRYPKARIYGHRDFAPKACPCFDAAKEYAEL